jgi:DNA-binding MarR family transcriptional regulator
VRFEQNLAAATFAGAATQVAPVPGAHAGTVGIAGTIERLIRLRRSRASFFSEALFSEPAWEILLVLALAETRYHRLTVSKLCARVDAPATTALRWIKLMTEAGLLVRSDDATDKRRKYIRLSADAYARMAEYCSSSNVAALAPA